MERDLLEGRGRLEDDPAHVGGQQGNGGGHGLGYRGSRQLREGRDEFRERTVAVDLLRPLGQLSLQHQAGVPGAVEGEIPAQAEKAVAHRPSVRHVAEEPHLRVKDPTFPRCPDLDDGALQVAQEGKLGFRHRDGARLAEDRDVLRVPPERFKEGHRVAGRLACLVLVVEEGEGERRRQERRQVEGVARPDGPMEGVPHRRPEGLQEQAPLTRSEQRPRLRP
jgi:hypothetical protein